jgi:hypothetical protein
MKKAIYTASVMAVCSLLLVGFGCGKKTASQDQPASGENAASVEEFTGTMSDLMKRGKPVHCTYTITQENTTQKGEMFIAGTKARSDMEIIDPGTGTQNVHAIALGNDQYVWGMQDKMGTKITMSLDEQQKIAEQNKETYKENSGGAPDVNQKINFKCTEWSVDGSKFEPPKDIQFQDMTDLFKNFTSGGATGGKVVDMCKICDSLPAGSSRDSCRQSSCK